MKEPKLRFKRRKSEYDTTGGTYNTETKTITVFIETCYQQAFDIAPCENNEETVIDVITHVISHETIHHILLMMFGYKTSEKFDNVKGVDGFYWLGSGIL